MDMHSQQNNKSKLNYNSHFKAFFIFSHKSSESSDKIIRKKSQMKLKGNGQIFIYSQNYKKVENYSNIEVKILR